MSLDAITYENKVANMDSMELINAHARVSVQAANLAMDHPNWSASQEMTIILTQELMKRLSK